MKSWLKKVGTERTVGSIYVECVPGVSSLNSCAALVGSPLMTDFAVVSMSDLLVPWDIIVKRVEVAVMGDYVTVIYNPASKKRVHQSARYKRDIFEIQKAGYTNCNSQGCLSRKPGDSCDHFGQDA